MDIEQLISPMANNSNGEYDEQGSATPLEPEISLLRPEHPPHSDNNNNYYSRYPHQQARTTTTIYSMPPPEMSPSMHHRPPTLAPRNGQDSRLSHHHHPAVGGGTHTQTPNRRMAHILSEQKRRENINSGFEELKSIVPSCHGCADSKAVILRKAVHYIQNLESEIEKLKQTGPTAMLTSNTPAASPIMHTSKTSSSSCISSSSSLNGVVGDVTTAKSGLSRNGNGGVTSVFSLNDPPSSDHHHQHQQQHYQQQQHHHHHHAYQWSTPQTITNGATNDNHRVSNNPPRRNTDSPHYTRHHYHHPHHHRPYEQPNGVRHYDSPSLTKWPINHRHKSSEGMLSSASSACSTSSSSSDDGGEHAPPPPSSSLIKIEGMDWGGCGSKFGSNYRIGNNYCDVPFPPSPFPQK